MPDILIWSGLFLFSLFTLILAADFFIKASERIGLILGIPDFIIGVTLIAVGTSLPELVTSIFSVLSPENASSIVPGNVIGSNLTNMGLVLGLVIVLAGKIEIHFDVMKVDGPLMLGATFLLFLTLQDGTFSWLDGMVCLAGLVIYLAYIISLGRSGNTDEMALEFEVDEEERDKFSWREPVILIASAVVIYFSASYNVNAIVNLAKILRIGQEFIAITAVALGTSLPELIVSIVAIRSGNAEMAVGNVIGSNIFNIFCVMGIPRVLGPIEVPDSLLMFSLPALIVVSVLFLFMLSDKKLNRWEGWMLLLFYGVVISYLITEQF